MPPREYPLWVWLGESRPPLGYLGYPREPRGSPRDPREPRGQEFPRMSREPKGAKGKTSRGGPARNY